MWRNTAERWGWAFLLMHWLTALWVVGLFALGYWMVGLDYYDDWYRRAPFIHKSLGVLLAGLILLRLLWRGFNAIPRALPAAAWQRWLARVTHALLYVLLCVCIASGYFISTADGSAIDVFGWFSVPGWPLGMAQQEELAGQVHEVSTWALVILAALHALAALKHHVFDRDETLRRMLGLKPRSTV